MAINHGALPASHSRSTGSGSFRPDIEGLRAIAVILVILYHAGIPIMRGGYVGVDVFFVISGFLITGLIVREIERDGKVDLLRFYNRRIRRLLPATTVTLIAVAAITLVVLPVTRWVVVGGDIVWSALYAINWRLAGQAVDYLAAGDAISPVQHFWSLSVEEQFYLVWPFLLLLLTARARRQGQSIRRPLLVGLAAVAIPSFVWSVYLTNTIPGMAYFVTTTRMWELALGGGLAILAPLVARIPLKTAEMAAWLGLAGIVVAAVTFDSTTAFPGWTALLPVLSTVVVIAAGTAHTTTAAARVLGVRPMRAVGAMSYSLYLWHWPVLVGAAAVVGDLSPAAGVVAAAVSAVPAWLAYRFVEQPFRQSEVIITPAHRGLAFGLALTILGVTGGLLVNANLPEIEPPVPAASTPLGSVPLETEKQDTPLVSDASPPDSAPLATWEVEIQETADSITPDPLAVRDDLPSVYADGCHQGQESAEVLSCTYGPLDSDFSVALVGDSHAAQWVPPMQVLADQTGFTLHTYTKSACQFAAVSTDVGPDQQPVDACKEWNELLVAELVSDEELDLVVTTGAFWAEWVRADGLEQRWSQLLDAGIPLVVIRDVPYPRIDVPECVAENRSTLIECAVDRSVAMDGNTPQLIASGRLGIPLIDLTDFICGSDLCPAVTRDLLVWRDRHHLTATYATTLAPALLEGLDTWLGES